jgi:DNA-directed RNA polymerase subunit RPC12/RpoP
VAQSFECPSCGAALDTPAAYTPSVKCPYCGRDVIVPAELRPHPATPPQPEGLVIHIKPPESGQGRPEITFNIPQTPEFQRMEQVLMQRQARPVRRATGCGGCGCFGTLLLMAAFAAVMIYIFGFSIKNNSMYACALTAARNNADVVKSIGTPITADTFAWISNYESSGSNETAHFTTNLTGPKGSGTLDVSGDRTRANLTLDVFFEFEGQEIVVHQGRSTCK